MKSFYRLLCACFVSACMIMSLDSYASHATGADLSYECLGNNQYRVTLSFFRDCAGIAADATASISIRSASCGVNTSVTLLQQGGGVEVSQLCPSQLGNSRCNGGTLPGIQQYTYSGVVTLQQCSDYVFGYDLCCRNQAITNLQDPDSYDMYVEATLNNTAGFCNNSPFFTSKPTPYVCAGSQFFYNHGAVDIDGDSLVYSLVNPLHNPGTTIPYNGGYSTSSPMLTTGAFNFNTATGQISAVPSVTQNAVITVLVKEYRNGVLIGSTMRDIQIIVINCPNNNPPTIGGINGGSGTSITIPAGSQTCFTIPSSDPDAGQTTTMTWNNAITGGTFTTAGSPFATGTFCWTPTAADAATNPHVFTVTVVDNSCPSIASQVVSFSVNVCGLGVDLGPDQSLCASAYTLSPLVSNGSAVYTYAWSDGSTDPTLEVTATGTYAVTVTDANGCSGADTINVSLFSNANQNLFAWEDTAVCPGTAVTIDAGPGYATYLWSDGSGNQTLTTTTSGVYSVTVTNQAGCNYSDTVTITVDNSLTVNINGGTICTGSSTTLDAGAGFASYLWTDGSGGQTLTVTSGGVYGVTVTSQLGCTASDTAIVDMRAPAFVSLGPDRVSCSAVTLIIRRPPGYTYNWSTGATTSTVTITSTGTYSVTVTDLFGCAAVDSINITISNISTLNLFPNTQASVCGGGSILLDAGAGFARYSWSTGDTTQTVNATTSGVYSVTVYDGGNCSVSDTITVSVGTPITGTVVTGSQCAPLTGTADLTVSGGTAPYTFAWSGPNGYTSSIEDINGLEIGTYDVVITDAAGCTGTASATIGLPTVIVDAGPDTVFICQGGSVQLNATGGVFYNWGPAAGLDNPDIADPIASPTVTTTYTVVGNQPSGELVVNGNFSAGNTGFSSTYGYTTTNLVPEGVYAVVTDPNPLHPAFHGIDHTTGTGNFMAINGSVNPGRQIWCQTVPVNPNTDYSFSTWIATLVANSPAVLEFTINGQLLGTAITAPASLNTWEQFFNVWNSGSATSAQICIVNTNTAAGGNDFGLDDISFTSVCQGTDSIVVVVNTPPTVTIGGGGIDSTCTGTNFTYDAGAGFASYQWSDGSTAQMLRTAVAGTYSVTVTDANGCTGSDTAELVVYNCCFPSGFGTVFTTIDSSNYRINTDQVWAGKYYVTIDVLVNGTSTLDLTNVDVVFAEGKGMIFSDNSKIRANNSVFRSCDATTSWAGFDFNSNSSGVFNGNLVKNAEIALDITSTQAVSVTNSEFYNFGTGLLFDNAGANGYDGAVTGNTFVSNDTRPAYLDVTGAAQTDFFAIKTYNTLFNGIISQNDFVNSMQSAFTAAPVNRYYGVYVNSSGLSASSNKFTNMYRAFDVTGNGQSVTLENNTIEYTQRSYFDIFPVRITDVTTSQVLVAGNTISYSEVANSSANQAGIYADNASNLVVSGNTVNGFATSVRIGGGSQFVNVLGNTLSDASSFGIFVEGGSNYNIAENAIDKAGIAGIALVDVLENASVEANQVNVGNYNASIGIGFITTAPINALTIRIADNCVRNSSTALYFTSTAALQNTIPVVSNNYLYNYKSTGLWNIGFVGQIGSCNNFPNEAGKNSFISNYLAPFGTALDVRSDSATLILSGNSANLVINFPNVLVNTSCTATSNTACGNQIGNNEGGGRLAGPLTQMLLFKDMVETSYPLVLSGNDYSLNSNYMNAISAKDASVRLKYIMSIMDVLNQNSTSAQMDAFFNAISGSSLVNANDMKWLSYTYSSYKGNYNAARSYLNSYVPATADAMDMVTIESIRTQLALNNKDVKSLSAGEIATLKAIDDKNTLFSAVARDMVQSAMGLHDYKFEQPAIDPIDADAAQLAGQQLNGDFINVFPNPADNQVKIRFFINTEELQLVNIRITDVLGQVLYTTPVNFNNGEITIDVSAYASGAYFVSLLNEKEVVSHTKLVKF
jgi:hypothetical protein